MNKLLDAIAYRLLVRVKEATPAQYYELQSMAQKNGYSLAAFASPFWWHIVRSHIANAYWSIRP